MARLEYSFKNRRIGDKRGKSVNNRSRIIAFALLAFFTFNVSVASAVFEDFTTYTEIDPNGRLSQTATTSSYTSLTRNEDAYLYLDKGLGHFDGDFTHYLAINYTSQDSGSSVVYLWAVGQELQSAVGMTKLSIYTYNSTIRIQETDSADNNYDSGNTSLILGNTYYLTIERDESIGTYGTLYVYVYTDETKTSLQATLSLALHESKKDFRYLYIPSSCNTGNAYAQTGYIENLDLNEEEEMATDTKILIENASTDASFYLDQTVSYGDMLVIAFLSVLIIGGVIKFILDLEIPKRMNFKK